MIEEIKVSDLRNLKKRLDSNEELIDIFLYDENAFDLFFEYGDDSLFYDLNHIQEIINSYSDMEDDEKDEEGYYKDELIRRDIDSDLEKSFSPYFGDRPFEYFGDTDGQFYTNLYEAIFLQASDMHLEPEVLCEFMNDEIPADIIERMEEEEKVKLLYYLLSEHRNLNAIVGTKFSHTIPMLKRSTVVDLTHSLKLKFGDEIPKEISSVKLLWEKKRFCCLEIQRNTMTEYGMLTETRYIDMVIESFEQTLKDIFENRKDYYIQQISNFDELEVKLHWEKNNY